MAGNVQLIPLLGNQHVFRLVETTNMMQICRKFVMMAITYQGMDALKAVK